MRKWRTPPLNEHHFLCIYTHTHWCVHICNVCAESAAALPLEGHHLQTHAHLFFTLTQTHKRSHLFFYLTPDRLCNQRLKHLCWSSLKSFPFWLPMQAPPSVQHFSAFALRSSLFISILWKISHKNARIAECEFMKLVWLYFMGIQIIFILDFGAVGTLNSRVKTEDCSHRWTRSARVDKICADLQ